MRRILVENAGRKGRDKHGGGRRREHPDRDTCGAGDPAHVILALHEALEQFSAHDPLKARLVELRFFGGLTLEQAAESSTFPSPPPTAASATPAPGCTPPWPATLPKKNNSRLTCFGPSRRMKG